MVTSEVPVTVRRAEFEIVGQKMVFNTQTRVGEMTGHVRMTIYNRQAMSAAHSHPWRHPRRRPAGNQPHAKIHTPILMKRFLFGLPFLLLPPLPAVPSFAQTISGAKHDNAAYRPAGRSRRRRRRYRRRADEPPGKDRR